MFLVVLIRLSRPVKRPFKDLSEGLWKAPKNIDEALSKDFYSPYQDHLSGLDKAYKDYFVSRPELRLHRWETSCENSSGCWENASMASGKSRDPWDEPEGRLGELVNVEAHYGVSPRCLV